VCWILVLAVSLRLSKIPGGFISSISLWFHGRTAVLKFLIRKLRKNHFALVCAYATWSLPTLCPVVYQSRGLSIALLMLLRCIYGTCPRLLCCLRLRYSLRIAIRRGCYLFGQLVVVGLGMEGADASPLDHLHKRMW
jgi:hypothetical protein